MVEAVPQPHGVDDGVQPRRVGLAAGDIQRKGDVLGGRERGHQIVGLEDESYALPAEHREPLLVERTELDVAYEDLALCQPVKAGHAV